MIKIGRYRASALVERVGAVAVYAAHDGARDVLLYVAGPLCGLDAGMFTRDVELLAELPPSLLIARVLEGGVQDGVFWVATEHHEGTTWAELCSGGVCVCPALLMTRDLVEIASRLEEAHRLGLIHGGLELGSVLLSHEGRLIFRGFGLKPLFRSALATDGRFRAPEHDREPMRLDARTDVYGLGRILRELFAAGQATAAGPSIPPLIQAVLARATAEEPSERYACMSDLRGALAAAVAEHCAAELGIQSGERSVTDRDHPCVELPLSSQDTLRSGGAAAAAPPTSPTATIGGAGVPEPLWPAPEIVASYPAAQVMSREGPALQPGPGAGGFVDERARPPAGAKTVDIPRPLDSGGMDLPRRRRNSGWTWLGVSLSAVAVAALVLFLWNRIAMKSVHLLSPSRIAAVIVVETRAPSSPPAHPPSPPPPEVKAPSTPPSRPRPSVNRPHSSEPNAPASSPPPEALNPTEDICALYFIHCD